MSHDARARSDARPALAPRVAVLTYHDVSPSPDGPYAVTPARLEADLRWFLSRGWRPLALAEFRDWMDGRRELAGDAFLLTFDDGYAGVIQHALPVLERLAVPATLFVISGRLGPVDPLRERPKLRPDAIAALSRTRRIAIGSHTHDLHRHVGPEGARVPAVVHAGPQGLAADLDASVARLTSLTGRAPVALAWPYGAAPAWAIDFAAERFPLVFTGEEGFARRGQPHAIPRFSMEWRTGARLAQQFDRRGADRAAAR